MNNKPLQDIVADYFVTSEACRLGILDDKSALVWSIVGKKYGEEGMYYVFDVLPREFGEQTNIQSPALTLEEIAKIIPGEFQVCFWRNLVRCEFALPGKVFTQAVACTWEINSLHRNAASAAMWCMIEIEHKKRAIAQKEEV